jgi:hypothetical protein
MRWRTFVLLAVLLALLTGYYIFHKPVDIFLIQIWIGFAVDLITVALIAISAGSIGHWLLARFVLRLESRAERVAVEAVLGLGVVAEVIVVIGLLGGFRGVILWPLLLIAGGATLIITRGSWLRDCVALLRQAIHPVGTWTRLLAAFVFFMLVLGLVLALMPPSAWDALTYHLVAPARYLADGRITTQANPYLGFPENTEMLYGLAMSLLGRDTAAAPIHWLFGMFALLGTAGLIRRTIGAKGESAAWLMGALLLSSFSLWLLFSWAYVDLTMMAFGAVIPIVLNYWQRTRRTSWLALTGLLVGLALGVKLTAGGLLIAAGVYLIVVLVTSWRIERRQLLPLLIRNGLIIGALAFLAFLPWFIKGTALYKNPVFPYVFGGEHWDAQRTVLYNEQNDPGDGLLGSDHAWFWPLLPLSATIFGEQGVLGFDFTTGPWLLTLPLLLVLAWPKRQIETNEKQLVQSSLAFVAPLLILWWMVSSNTNLGIQVRFMTMALPTMALLGALAVRWVQRWPIKPINMFFMLQAIFILSFAFAAVDAARLFIQLGGVSYAFGLTDRDTVLNTSPPYYYAAMQRLETLPAGAKVHFLWEMRGYYCPAIVQCQVDYVLDDWQQVLLSGQTPDQAFAGWKGSGDSYFLINNDALKFFLDSPRTADAMKQYIATFPRWLSPIWSNEMYTLYSWKPF